VDNDYVEEFNSRISFCKWARYDGEVRSYGITFIEDQKTVSLDFYPFSVVLYWGKFRG